MKDSHAFEYNINLLVVKIMEMNIHEQPRSENFQILTFYFHLLIFLNRYLLIDHSNKNPLSSGPLGGLSVQVSLYSLMNYVESRLT